YGVFAGTSPRKSIWSQSIGDVIGKGENHVVGTGRKACVRYVPCITGGSGEIRTRDQRIKRSRSSSKPYIAYGPERPKNECAIEFFWCIALNLVFTSSLG
ncbi:hypothetical protein, partial [Polynucleobacter sp. 15G-AUS-farblos]|uniref:hypothetical protein n=1 Tax=Polynucleobacter sp. 15G-AUS-farblos TaxID=2689094 RepID=UPI001C0D4CE5